MCFLKKLKSWLSREEQPEQNAPRRDGQEVMGCKPQAIHHHLEQIKRWEKEEMSHFFQEPFLEERLKRENLTTRGETNTFLH